MQHRRRSFCSASSPSSASPTNSATTSSWMSPRMRSNNLRENSPDRSSIAAAARLATGSSAAGENAASRSRLTASGPIEKNTVERCRRHSYHAATTTLPSAAISGGGSPPPPLRHAWRFTAATGTQGEVQSARSPTGESVVPSIASDASPLLAKREVLQPMQLPQPVPENAAADLAAGLAGSFSPVSGHRALIRPATCEAELIAGDVKTPTATPTAREDSGQNFSFAPSPTQAATEATPLTKPRRLTRASSALRSCNRTEPQRAHSADPRRRKEKEMDISLDDTRQQDALATCRRAPATNRASDACLPTARDGGSKDRERPGVGAADKLTQPVLSPVLSPALRRPAPFKSLASTVFGGKYHAGKYLGRGASATVWEASHSDSNLRVAVKVFDQGSRDKRQAHREVRVLSRVQHPSILEAYEVIESTLYAQLVCELVDGESLRAFAQRQPGHRLQEGPCRRFYQQVVEGINYCHEKLVVHRDVKLENLLLDKGGERVKIIDFGFATQVASRDTKLRAFCGTPSYMAPEIVRGEGYSGFATDVWALGVVLFALFCGALPFVGRTEMQLYAKIRRGTFVCPDLLVDPPRRIVKSILRLETLARPSAAAVLRQPWVSGDSRPQSDCQVSCLSPGRGCKSVDQQGAGHERARLAEGSYSRKDRSESPGMAGRRFSGRGSGVPTTVLGGS